VKQTRANLSKSREVFVDLCESGGGSCLVIRCHSGCFTKADAGRRVLDMGNSKIDLDGRVRRIKNGIAFAGWSFTGINCTCLRIL